jgi:hypothetical protein
MESVVLLDRAGRRRSQATLSGFHQGRVPRNNGLRYPPDPPPVEEIIAVMRTAGDGPAAMKLRGLITVGERVGELSVNQPADEVAEALAFHHCADLVVVGDAVVAGWELLAFGARLLVGELVGVALAAVHEDLQVGEISGAAAGDPDAGPGLAGGAGRTARRSPRGRPGCA